MSEYFKEFWKSVVSRVGFFVVSGTVVISIALFNTYTRAKENTTQIEQNHQEGRAYIDEGLQDVKTILHEIKGILADNSKQVQENNVNIKVLINNQGHLDERLDKLENKVFE